MILRLCNLALTFCYCFFFILEYNMKILLKHLLDAHAPARGKEALDPDI